MACSSRPTDRPLTILDSLHPGTQGAGLPEGLLKCSDDAIVIRKLFGRFRDDLGNDLPIIAGHIRDLDDQHKVYGGWHQVSRPLESRDTIPLPGRSQNLRDGMANALLIV